MPSFIPENPYLYLSRVHLHCLAEVTSASPRGAQRDKVKRAPVAPKWRLKRYSVLRRSVLTGTVTEQRASQVLQDLADLTMERVAHATLLRRVWELRGNFTAYDACYVAVAELFHAPLLTYDAKMANASGARCAFEVFPATA
jgi:predicted nucleic acid-binding protein